MSEAVGFKGNKDGIVLMLDCSIDFEALCQMIVQKLWDSRNFLGDHATLIVNSGKTVLDQGQRLALKVLLQSLGHEVKYFIPDESSAVEQQNTSEKTAAAVHQNIAVNNDETRAENPEASVVERAASNYNEEKNRLPELADVEHYLAQGALVVRKNIRSGQKIAYDGTLVIFGDVNAGAELVATGHILVLGALRGVAHAGCQGDKKAIIYANQLRSVQLRIADLIARAPDGEIVQRNTPEIARIIDNYLVIEEI